MIGDKASDVLCGRAAGTKTIFIRTGYALDAPCEPDFIAADMTEAVDWILQECR
jgi:phosphoglycolate phosphatase-like HAD superfamily hydrolase